MPANPFSNPFRSKHPTTGGAGGGGNGMNVGGGKLMVSAGGEIVPRDREALGGAGLGLGLAQGQGLGKGLGKGLVTRSPVGTPYLNDTLP